MISAKVLVRVVAVIYALFCIVCLAFVWAIASSTSAAHIPRKPFIGAASAIPGISMWAIGCFVLSVLSLRFLKLGRAWRITTLAGSLLMSLRVIWVSASLSAESAPFYMALGQEGRVPLAILLGTYSSLALVFSICPLLLWSQLRASASN